MSLNVLDLFSGIGGFSLGLERAGMRTVAFCEIEPYPRAILRQHWPSVPCYDDVRALTAERLAADGIGPIDVICGGFPCQDISTAGKGAGIEGERSGLWSEYARLVGELRPRFVIVENVAALLGRGLSVVLGDLAALGFDAEWNCIPASAVGAPHRRDRIWIIAYPASELSRARRSERPEEGIETANRGEVMADTTGQSANGHASGERETHAMFGISGNDVADDSKHGRRARRQRRLDSSGAGEQQFSLPHATLYAKISEGIRRGDAAGQWWVEPDMGRVAHGIPARVDRLRGLGNAVVPQIPEIIGRAIVEGLRR